MRESIPYEKEIVFNTKIAEITSISLEYEANVLDEDIEGDFIVSGDYKIHELSVNKEPFKYRIPFSVSLTDDIIRDSIKYDINNFTYEIVDDDTLRVNISFGIDYELVKEKVLKEEESIEKEDNLIDREDKTDGVLQTREDKASLELNNLLDDIELNNTSDNKKVLDNTFIQDSGVTEVKNTTLTDNTNKEVVLNNVSNALNTYVTYHIHVLSEGEDIDTIINKYKVNKDIIEEYNQGLEWVVGEKVIIPELQDE